MSRTATIAADYAEDIEEAADRFGDHEDMTPGRVVRWLMQFEDPDLPLAAHVLRSVHYINATNIRAMTRQLFDMAVAEFAARGIARGAFVAVGSLGAGSGTVARVIRDAIQGTDHRLVSMLELSRAASGEYDAIVFIDDFSGTGESLEDWWIDVESLVRPVSTQVFVGLLVLNEAARSRIEAFADILAVEELDLTHNTLGNQGATFTDKQKRRVREYCLLTGVAPEYRGGYGNCALLLAFKHGCPDNSLPILWEKNDDWRSLFNRRAI
jgi:hypothetical protein